MALENEIRIEKPRTWGERFGSLQGAVRTPPLIFPKLKASIEVVLDTGPLVAWLSRADQHHSWCASVFSQLPLPVVTCEAVVAEALIAFGSMGPGWMACANFWSRRSCGLTLFAIFLPFRPSCGSIRRDFADASVVWLSEQYPKARVFTVDFRDFKVYRRFKNQAVPLIEKS